MMHHPKVHSTTSMVDDSNLNTDSSQMGYPLSSNTFRTTDYSSSSAYPKGQALPSRPAYDYGSHTHGLMQPPHPQHPVFTRQTQMMDPNMMSGALQYPAEIQGSDSSNIDAAGSMSDMGLSSYYTQLGDEGPQPGNILSQSRIPESAEDHSYPFQTTTVPLSGEESPKSLSLTDDSAKDNKKRKVESPNARETSTSPKKTSSGPKKFICDQYEDCHAEFQRKEHLERHIRKHTGEKPFRCPCGKTFTRRDNLRQHGQSVHGKENQPPDFWAQFDEQCAPSTRQPGKRNSVSRRTKKGHSRVQSTSSIASSMSSMSGFSGMTSPGQWPNRPNSFQGSLSYLDPISQSGDLYMDGRPESAHSYTGSVMGGPIPAFSSHLPTRYAARPMSLNMGGDYPTDPIRPMGPGAARRTSLISNQDSRNSVYSMFESQGYRPGTGNSIAASTYSQEMPYQRRSSFVNAPMTPMHESMMQRPLSGMPPQAMYRSAMPQVQDQSIPENAATDANVFGHQRRESQLLPGIDTFSRAAESGEYRRPPSSNILSSSPTSSQFPVQQMSMQMPMTNRNVMSSPARPDVFARPYGDASLENTPQRRVVPPTSGRVALPSIVQMSIPARDAPSTPTQQAHRSDLPHIAESPRTSSGNWARDASASLSNIVGEERAGVGANPNFMRAAQSMGTGMHPPPVPGPGAGSQSTNQSAVQTQDASRHGETGTLNMLLEAAQAQEK